MLGTLHGPGTPGTITPSCTVTSALVVVAAGAVCVVIPDAIPGTGTTDSVPVICVSDNGIDVKIYLNEEISRLQNAMVSALQTK